MDIDIDQYAEGAIILDGLDSAIIGITQEFGNGPRILYSKNKILEISKFNLMSLNWSSRLIALGGVKMSNFKKIKMTKSVAVGIKSFIEF